MATPEQCVFDLDVPRRPGIDDVGGGQKEDDSTWPPNPRTTATAADLNQWQNLLVRFSSVLPMAILQVSFSSGGSPNVDSFLSVKDSSVTVNIFEIHVADGVTIISWPAGTFPLRTVDHTAAITGATPGLIATQSGDHVVSVRTTDLAGVATTYPFVVTIYGD